MSKECTTHHHACDCREAKFKELEQENAALRAAFKSAVILREHEDGLDRIQKYVQKGCLLSGEVLLLMNRTAFDAARKEAQP